VIEDGAGLHSSAILRHLFFIFLENKEFYIKIVVLVPHFAKGGVDNL